MQPERDRFRRIFERIRDVILLGFGIYIIYHEVNVRSEPNLVAVGVGLVFCFGPTIFMYLPSWLGGSRDK